GQEIKKPATYDLIYLEVSPTNVVKTLNVLRAAEAIGRKEKGNLGFLVLQRHPNLNQFLIVGLWTDNTSLVAYQNSASTQQFRATLQPMMIAPYDERPNIDFLTNSTRDRAVLSEAPKNSLFVLAHVDIDP